MHTLHVAIDAPRRLGDGWLPPCMLFGQQKTLMTRYRTRRAFS
jgi:hypothetical protein